MSRASVVLAALSGDPTSTSDLYDRVGYGTLVGVGLVAYEAFRAELVSLSDAGLAEGETPDDGPTMWRLREAPASSDDAGERIA